jgi:hypothetical protein
MSSRERDHALFDEADEIVTQFTAKTATALFDRIQKVINGDIHLNHDGKRVLCNEMNEWLLFLSQEEPPFYFQLNAQGDIVQAFKNDSP